MNQEELREFIESDITPTQALNVILEICLSNMENFDKNDSIMIKKASSILYNKVNEGKNFMIKVK